MIMVSACLLGIPCRYDGQAKAKEEWKELLKHETVTPICPEQMGGLTTPRPPAEIQSENPLKVVNQEGEDVTACFIKGAEAIRDLALQKGIKGAVLKERSPSCGKNQIYDGSFSGKTISGSGITTRELQSIGVIVFSEEETEPFENWLKSL